MIHDILHITENLTSGWLITNAEGQHIAVVGGAQNDALAYAHRLADGAGKVVLDAPDEF